MSYEPVIWKGKRYLVLKFGAGKKGIIMVSEKELNELSERYIKYILGHR